MKDKNTKNLRKSMNRGSVEQTTKVADYEGEIMTLAKKDVISIPPTKTIKGAAEMMIEHGFRRLPVTHPGSNKLLGIVTAMDILDFLGGGSKFDIIEKKHDDNFLAAINDPVKEIMTRDVISISPKYSIRESVDVMTKNGIGSLPIVDKEERLVGIVTERDFALALAGSLTNETVGDIMIKDVITTTPGTPIESCSKIMVRNNLRRIPVVEEEKLIGIVTSTDILRFFGDKEMFASMTSNSGLDVLKRKISEIIKPNILVTESTVRLGDLCELLAEKNIGGVPVVDDDQLVGIVTERDILNTVLKE
ncbi:MAG: CBS domain-containing protein [Methanobrevibacter ruminantium]|uniref:CBS domain-containing protein n=1 Tax=Methanobrevibacter ruminantium TaxID=83816 RepID=UPI0026E9CCEC|nr:CBS domain-containing protein [Methanobrevibacter ruminantium]MCI5737620.1 CBS domain-containing protein [Methanobrevibacter ruminantium]MDO5843030.1 CBS domain-containing protein [Methanobrevibacter ruminantium]